MFPSLPEESKNSDMQNVQGSKTRVLLCKLSEVRLRLVEAPEVAVGRYPRRGTMGSMGSTGIRRAGLGAADGSDGRSPGLGLGCGPAVFLGNAIWCLSLNSRHDDSLVSLSLHLAVLSWGTIANRMDWVFVLFWMKFHKIWSWETRHVEETKKHTFRNHVPFLLSQSTVSTTLEPMPENCSLLPSLLESGSHAQPPKVN